MSASLKDTNRTQGKRTGKSKNTTGGSIEDIGGSFDSLEGVNTQTEAPLTQLDDGLDATERKKIIVEDLVSALHQATTASTAWKNRAKTLEKDLDKETKSRLTTETKLQDAEKKIAQLQADLHSQKNLATASVLATKEKFEKQAEDLRKQSWMRTDAVVASYRDQLMRSQEETGKRITELETRLDATASEKQRLEFCVTQLEAMANNLREQNHHNEARAKQLEAAFVKTTKEKKTLEIQIEQVEAKHSTLHDQYLITLQERELLSDRLGALNEKLQALHVAYQTSLSNTRKIEQTKRQQEAERRALIQKTREAEEAVKRTQNEITRLKSELPLRQLLEQKKAAIQKLQTELLKQKRSEVQDEIQKTIGFITEECAGLEELIASSSRK